MSEEKDKMPAIAIDDKAREWLVALEKREAARHGLKAFVARQRIAARLGIASGTSENIVRRRTKGIRAGVFNKICAVFAEEARQEILRLEHERLLAIQTGLDARCGEVSEIEADLAALREVVK